MAEKKIKIKITSAVAIDGKIIKPGDTVTVAEDLAKNLLNRGRCELATGGSDLGKLKKDDLFDIAVEKEIDGIESMSKDELIKAIDQADAS